MITVGDHVLWSYINPINDPDHHACIMIWEKNSEPKVFLQSEYSATDYMLYNDQDDIYIIERRHQETTQSFEFRLLKATIDRKVEVIWDWSKDEWRIGEGGFFMLSDNQMIFGKYPEIYSLRKYGRPQKYFDIGRSIRRIRAVENNLILLLGENACYLTRQDGSIVKQWNQLIDEKIKDAPLNRNQIFDVDYKKGNLLIAYWGKRSFEWIDKSGERQTLIQQSEPLTPHWVALWNNNKLLFSSELIFDGSTPQPRLILMDNTGKSNVIWN
ncbi:hypothetical protein DCC35_16140 [Mangrovivirga cuniculi]|uniref:Uncharacterized protein n=2 Tax=Mangrovivirga cuniculi TaxID=2715131 RepID=A0A4D7JU76_9BACT|nr:hypothetical protein DCC35_16140 [Mangrovivirga cuniculi]